MVKFLKKIFRLISYFLFSKVYGKIGKSIESTSDERIKIKIANMEKDLNYKVYKILDGKLYTDRIHDTAFILDNKIIEGPSFQFRYNNSHIYNSEVRENIVFHKGTPRILKKLNGITLSLLTGGAGNSNYWHWLVDVLPRLSLCDKTVNLKKIDFFLFPSLLKKFQNETLDCLNIPKNKRLSSEKFRHIKAKELIATEHPVVVSGNASKDIENIPNWIILWLKDNFLNQNIAISKKNKKKIYIDRDDSNSNKASQRLISNEDEVKKYLLEKNFIPIKLHEIEFKEQVDLFYNAECIVGLHGAGFANFVFCKPKTKVIELRSFNTGPMYENFAKKNDLNYYSVISESKQIDNSNVDLSTQQGSINVSIASLNKILEN